jgi:rod shape-determining protein MreD
VKAAAVCLATILALAVQTTMLPFALAGRGHVDLVLVVVIYAALQFGPATGLLTGALAGMAQDALSGGVIGVGGVAKTIVGFLAGAIGSQFIVANAVPRFVVLLFGAALHSACVLGLYAVIDKRGFAALSWRTAWPQVLMTAGIGIILIQTVQSIPGFLMRRRLRRGY